MKPGPILCAEDDENDVFFLLRAFKLAKIDQPIVVVADGREAIEYCCGCGANRDRDENPLPSLVLLDVNLPVQSGVEVLCAIRADPVSSSIPVIILSSSVQESDVIQAYSNGANAYLVKPSQPEDLVGLVKSIHRFWIERGPARK